MQLLDEILILASLTLTLAACIGIDNGYTDISFDCIEALALPLTLAALTLALAAMTWLH